MRKHLLLVGFILGIVVLSAPAKARATLFSLNDLTYGVGAFTQDTQTGLQWLDLSLTLNKSMNDIIANSGTGGSYAGLRYATQDEVWNLFSNAGISPVLGTFDNKARYDAERALLDLIGFGNKSNMLGITGTGPVNPFDIYVVASLYVNADIVNNLYLSSSSIGAYVQSVLITSNSQDPSLGSFLVREAPSAPTPEPSTFLLLGSVIAAAGFLRKRFQL